MINPQIPVFIASPGDVKGERQAAVDTINELSERLVRLAGVTLTPVRWESFAPIATLERVHPQVVINKAIQPYSIFVGILGKRHGTSVDSSERSGTEAEFDKAITNRDSIRILTYFKRVTGRQKKVATLQRRLLTLGILAQEFGRTDEFRRRFNLDLFEAVLDMLLSDQDPWRIHDYQSFFRFSSHHRVTGRPLVIVYPAMTAPGSVSPGVSLNWRHRLLPHVIFEDYKAIQDLEEVFRLLKREYKTLTTDSPDLPSIEPGDRVWVCVPRNRLAQRILIEIDTNAAPDSKPRFRFRPHRDDAERQQGGSSVLEWQLRSGEWLKIASPLSEYLRQAGRVDEDLVWRPSMGQIYARDYAVLARFRVERFPGFPSREWYYHYFVGGIRGLGTWGIGYLIDHESPKLVEAARRSTERAGTDPGGCVQMLFEVEYFNYRVVGVRDVSEETAAFFRERSDEGYIGDTLSARGIGVPDQVGAAQ